MEAPEVIESYVDDVARRLPRKLRNDVGLELRALLGDQLRAAAAQAARDPDERLAIDLVQRFGRPADVASRYRPRGFDLIEPEYAPLFVKLAVVCVGLQWAFTLPAVFDSRTTLGAWWVSWGLGALAWPGALLLWFAAAAWVRRASPADPDTGRRPWTHWIFWLPMAEDWRPPSGRRPGRIAIKIQIALATVATIFFAAPAWFLSLLIADSSWARYDDDFSRWLVAPLIALCAVRVVLFAAVAADARRRAATESLRFGLWVALVGLLYWAAFGWTIFATPAVDALFKAWLSIFLLVNTLQILVWIRRETTRVRARDLRRV
jgi:hypothetical protein